MDLFGRFKKLDSSLQRGLDNGFARVFGGKVVPTEIDELLKQQAEESVMSDGQGTTLAPNKFNVEVSQKDLDSMLRDRPRLTEDLADRLSRYIRNQGWTTTSPVLVNVTTQPTLHTGQLKVEARFEQIHPDELPNPTASGGANGYDPSGESNSPQASHYQHGDPSADSNNPQAAQQQNLGAQPDHQHQLSDVVDHTQQAQQPSQQHTDLPSPPTSYPGTEVIAQVTPDIPARGGHGYAGEGQEIHVSLILRDGSDRVYQLKEGANVIGRGNGVDLRIPDTGVSRSHAEVQWDGFDAVLTDLNSTNGTSVNGTPIENWLLAHGDIIAMGHSEIEVQFH